MDPDQPEHRLHRDDEQQRDEAVSERPERCDRRREPPGDREMEREQQPGDGRDCDRSGDRPTPRVEPPSCEARRTGGREAHDDRREDPACAERRGERAEPGGPRLARRTRERRERLTRQRQRERGERDREHPRARIAEPNGERPRQPTDHRDRGDRESVRDLAGDRPREARPAVERPEREQDDQDGDRNDERDRERLLERPHGRCVRETLGERRGGAFEAGDETVARRNDRGRQSRRMTASTRPTIVTSSA